MIQNNRRNRPYSNALRTDRPNNVNNRRSSNILNPVHSSSRIQRTFRSNEDTGASQGGGGPRAPRRRNVVFGTKEQNASLASSEKISEIFVGGCSKEATDEELKEYCNNNGVPVKKCELLNQTSEWSRSFKLSINANHREKILSADFWPAGIYVRHFYRAKHRNST